MATYKLTKYNDAWARSTVKVYRNNTWTEIDSGETISTGERLKITFSMPSSYYPGQKIKVQQVNGRDFKSGNELTVNEDVVVYVSTSGGQHTQPRGLSPDKPYIEDEVTLKVFVALDQAYSSIRIVSGDMIKYISLNQNGTYSLVNTLTKIHLGYGSHNIKFRLPIEIYNNMPVDKIGSIVVECITFDKDRRYVEGAPDGARYYVYAKTDSVKPSINATVRDVNATTKALTGDSSGKTLIRYMSSAKCDMTATVRPPDTTWFAEAQINHGVVYLYHGNASTKESQISKSRTIEGDSLTSPDFEFYARDSRGGIPATTVTISFDGTDGRKWINYRKPQFRDVNMSREFSGDDDVVYVDFYGYFYNGNFNGSSNSNDPTKNVLKIRYRYREDGSNNWSSDSSHPDGWSDPIDVNHIRFSGNNEYGVFRSGDNTAGPIAISPISGNFDHTKSYTFQFEVSDGSSTITLASARTTVTCPPSIPVFDWGKTDFNFNVPVKINNVNIFDIVYPIGSIYFCYSNGQPSAPPAAISEIGEWYLVGAAMTNIYAWLRTG